MNIRKQLKRYIVFFALILSCAFLALSSTPALALSVDFNNLIDDPVFDAQAMTAPQVDSFLNSFPNSCISSNHGFRAPDPTGYSPTTGFTYGANTTAGKVISDAASAYGLNPQVLLATLQKEQSLVTGSSGCSTLAYAGALGYGCPDGGTTHNYSGVNLYTLNGREVTSVNGTCVGSALDVGFSQQIIHATWLLKFDEERSEGKVTWAVIKGNWDNSDDLSTCYDPGFMTQGTFQRCPSGPAAPFDGFATIDGVSIHMDNGATAALYDYTPHKSGNSNFDTIFTTWFGSLRGTPFFMINGSTKTYMIGANNTYYYVTSPTELADYGYTLAWGYIMHVTSSYVSGDTFAGNLPTIARFGGDEIYLVNQSALHHFTSPAMLSTYGYAIGQEAQLPSWTLDHYARTTDMQAILKQSDAPQVYAIVSGKKQHIINPTAYATLGSPVYSSQPSVTLDSSYANQLPTGAPIMPDNTITKTTDTNSYGIWDGSSLQKIDTSTATSIGYPADYAAPASVLNQLPASANPTLGKLAKDTSNNLYILDSKRKLLVPSGLLSSLGLSSSSFISTDAAFLNRFSTAPMQSTIRINNGTPVYAIQSGQLYHIYSGTDLVGLGFSFSSVLNVNATTGSLFPNSNKQLLAPGKLVRIGNQPEVYVIDGSFSKEYISSPSLFADFGYRMSDVTSVSNSDLVPYITGSNLAQIDKDTSGTVWLIDLGVKHRLSTTMLGATNYNIVANSVPILPDQIFSHIPSSNDVINIVQVPGQDPIYAIENGQKHWFTTASSFLSHGGDWNNIMKVSSYYLASVPTGDPIN